MKKMILKYPLNTPGTTEIEMSVGTKILSAQEQRGQLTL